MARFTGPRASPTAGWVLGDTTRATRVEENARTLTTDRALALVCRRLFQEPSPLLRVGRFELIRTLGRGGNGIVYEAIDSDGGHHCALKVLHGQSPTHLFALKREFRSLSELHHPNLVALHELCVEPEGAFFTMDLVLGRDFVSYVRTGTPRGKPPASERRLRNALVQLAEGIFALHQSGKLHRDLKPSNVLVTDAGRVILLDFGLVRDVHDGEQCTAGTTGYIAPEQATGAACEASDWFAFGCILREALLGERSGQHPGDSGETRLPSHGVLGALTQRLLAPSPNERPGFEEILHVLEGAKSRPTHATRRLPFVGRSRELGMLEAAFERSRRVPLFAHVRGDAGMGKTELLDEFCRRTLIPAGALVLRGRCHERECVPFKGMDAVVDELSRHLMTPPTLPLDLGPDDIGALLRIFPVLGRVRWLAHGATPPAICAGTRVRGSWALAKLLHTLARMQPLVLCIDDFQWAGSDSGRLLGLLLDVDAEAPLLVVAADRSEPGENPAVLELQATAALSPARLEVREAVIQPLDHAAVARLARAALPFDIARRHIQALRIESQGNPLFAQELLRSLQSGRDFQDRSFDSSASLDGVFEQRLSSLNDADRSVLALVAAAGRPVRQTVLAHATDDLGIVGAELGVLQSARLIRTSRRTSTTPPEVEIAHERLGRYALGRLSPAKRHRVHRALARALEQGGTGDPQAVVEQYVAAGMPAYAAPRAREGADAALRAGDFVRAAWLYDQAVRWGTWNTDERVVLHRDHASALEHAGKGLASAAAYLRAAALTGEVLARARLEERAAELLVQAGRAKDGELLLRRVYLSLGVPWPRGRAALAVSAAGYCLPSGLRRLARPKRQASLSVRRARAALLSAAGRALQMYDPLRAIHNALICLDEGERLPDRVWRARARGARGMMKCSGLIPGSAARGLAEVEAACAVADEMADDAARADLYCQLAIARHANGRLRAALEAAETSERCRRRLPPSPTDLAAIAGVIGTILCDLGRLREAHRRWNAAAYEARLHGDITTSVWLQGYARLDPLLARDERDGATQVLDQQRRLRDTHPRYRSIAWAFALSHIECELYWGSPRNVETALARSERSLFASGYGLFTETARLAQARARLTLASGLQPGRQRTRLLDSAVSSVAFTGRRRSVLLDGDALLAEAGVALLRGQPGAAQSRLAQALRAYEAAEARLRIATANYCLGALTSGRAGEALQRQASRALRSEGVRHPARWVAWKACGFRNVLETLT